MYILMRQIKSHNFIFIGIMASCGRDIRPEYVLVLFCVCRLCILCCCDIRVFEKKAIKIYPNIYLNFYFDGIANSTKAHRAAIELSMDLFFMCCALRWPFLTFKMIPIFFFFLKTDKWLKCSAILNFINRFHTRRCALLLMHISKCLI